MPLHLFLQRPRLLLEEGDQGASDGFADLERTAFDTELRTERRAVHEEIIVYLVCNSLAKVELFCNSI